MAKQLNFTYDGRDYTLEYTRKTVENMERSGFNINQITEAPMSIVPALFAGAFLSRHKFEKRNKIDEIYKKMPNKNELLSMLTEMYRETVETLFDEPDEADEGNVQWTPNW